MSFGPFDFSNKKFGKWTALWRTMKGRHSFWVCRCECGTERTVRIDILRNGTSLSCGCDRWRGGKKLHGFYGTPENRTWNSIIRRCENKNQKNWRYYGARGIKVCDRWRNSFDAFLADMGQMPAPGLTIDRIDNDGDYEPGNCRWATQFEQASNTNRNHFIEFKGVRLTLTQWARRTGIKQETIRKRLKNGWSVERALMPGDFRT